MNTKASYTKSFGEMICFVEENIITIADKQNPWKYNVCLYADKENVVKELKAVVKWLETHPFDFYDG